MNKIQNYLVEKFRDALRNKEDVLIVTHNNCMDGYGSILAIATTFNVKPSELNIHLTDYSDDPTELIKLSKNRLVLFIDFSLDVASMTELRDTTKALLVIDHHESAYKNLNDFDYLIYDVNESGATLAWKVFNPDTDIPILLQYIRDRDIWTWELENSRAISAGLQKALPFGKINVLNDVDIYDIGPYLSLKEIGIVEYQSKVSNSAASKDSRYVSLDGLITLPVINTTTQISDIGNIISAKHAASCTFFITNTDIIFSLRSNRKHKNWINVAELAGHFGGGGHKHAAGFSFKLTEFNFYEFFINNYIKK